MNMKTLIIVIALIVSTLPLMSGTGLPDTPTDTATLYQVFDEVREQEANRPTNATTFNPCLNPYDRNNDNFLSEQELDVIICDCLDSRLPTNQLNALKEILGYIPAVSRLSSTATVEAEEVETGNMFLMGDVNLNGVLDHDDAMIIYHNAGEYEVTIENADMNGDGAINPLDAFIVGSLI